MKTKILVRYILSSHIGPYLFALSVITFVFVMGFIIRWIGKFIANGVKLSVVLEFFVLSLGHMFALIIPMSVMPATLMAFGQLAAENEIIAMKSSGISLYRMLRTGDRGRRLHGDRHDLLQRHPSAREQPHVDQMLALISTNWVRPPVGSGVEAIVFYRIQRDGRVTELRIVHSSGINSFDLAVLRAVQSSSPLPPLPRGFKDGSLGVNLIVR